MINLGLARNFESCPDRFARLSFLLPVGEENKGPLLAAHPAGSRHVWHLYFPCKANQNKASWARELALCLQCLGHSNWCLNTHDLAEVMELPLDEALRSWGELFWPYFIRDSVFIFTAGDDPMVIKEILGLWHRSMTCVCLRRQYDLTEQEFSPSQAPGTGHTRSGLWKKLIFPAYLLRTGCSRT